MRSALVAAACLFHFAAWSGEVKQIRLRNESIATAPPPQTGEVSNARQQPDRGLFLVQFTGPVEPEWRARLASLGVELLRYVPDNAFVAEFSDVPPGRVQSLPFVRWTGSYRPEHKVHKSVAAAASGRPGGEEISVSVLLSPRATPQAAAAARGQLHRLEQESHLRFGTILRGRVAAGRLNALAQSRAVLWVEPGPQFKLLDEVASKIVAGDGGPNLLHTQTLGYDGSGVTVSVADSGLHNGDAGSMHPDLFGRVSAFFHYGSLLDASDEHSHGTHVTGIIAGNGATGELDDNSALYGLGVAPGAGIVAQRIFDGAGNYHAPPSFETLTRHATGAGAEIGSNSWGDDTQGRYDLSAAEFDALVRDADALTPGDQPYILEFSAGNAGPGPQTIATPAVAKNVIATGASQNDRPDLFIYDEGIDAMADFSSRGPCEDGRIKPDLVAPGTWIASLKSASATDENAWLPISAFYMYQGGTSQAGPHVSGAAAVFVQYYRTAVTNRTPSPALVKAALINSAADMDDPAHTSTVPNMDEGWGRVDLPRLLDGTRRHEFLDQSVLLSTGQEHERRVVVAGADQPLKVTLTYTDVPGFPGALPALVNDLDLEVVGPDGRIYRGNQFDEGESVPGAPSADTINNVEAVHIASPKPGEYLVRVRARNVPEDARADTGAVDQDFALVVSGNIPLPGAGLILLDRGAYTAPGQIHLRVIDSDLQGASSVNVVVKSTTEPAGEAIPLFAAGFSGVFTGAVATATGPPSANGVLQISHNDVIEALYFDASAGVFRSATATGDLIPPVLTGVSVTNQFGKTVVAWTSDESSDSIVRFGTNASLALSATNTAMTASHSVALTGLVAGVTYYFDVRSADEAGNAATNNNGGALYSFIAQPSATILLVDAYVPDNDSPFIPVSTYTNALNHTGLSYDVWTVTQRGAPLLPDLQPYQAVIWRISDSIWTTSTHSQLSASQQTMIQNYLNGGGAFLMASMEILSRLGNVSFRSNVLQVAGFVPNPDPFSPCPSCDEDHGVPSVAGVAGEPLTEGMAMANDYSSYPEIEFFGLGPDFSDTFTAKTNAAAILVEPGSGKTVGARFPRTGQDSTGRVAFLSFPLDTLPESGPAPNNRGHLLRNLMSFLVPGVNGLGTVALDNSAYTVPGLVTVEVGDSDIAGTGTTTATFYRNGAAGGVTITLSETVRRGLFRGTLTLVPTNAAAGPGQLQAAHGDTLRAEYADTSNGGIVHAAAVVDTQAPLISGVSSDPDYDEATVTWTASEPTDALVQFGESILLGRTAYDPAFGTAHEVTLKGLLPDRVYYYQVVSRDVAGNATIDNNGGVFHTFRTLKPVSPPWTDTFETGATNWTVFDSEDTQSSWTLGIPSNGRETAAHSPTQAWGSNRTGDPIDYAETFLISPAIDLTGGNQAQLRFWHSYDFNEVTPSDLLETGQLLIITNSASQPVPLRQYGFDSFGWEEETVDLSPYAGRVVYLVWYYQLLSFETASRPGWLVDDVSVTLSNVAPGVVQISNNLAQATFALTGPLNRNGSGTLTTVTNAPPGQYSVTFGTVPYYLTPPTQTNSLPPGGSILVTGHYSFTDANTNGISDAWEQAHFGGVSPTRTATTDTDLDGFSDFAEFIAGTDPNRPDSKLFMGPPTALPNGTWRIDWDSVPGRTYRVEASGDLVVWIPVSGWIKATGAQTSLILSPPLPAAQFLRVEVIP